MNNQSQQLNHYYLDPQEIGKYGLFLRYGSLFLRTGEATIHFSPQETLDLMEWLQGHQSLIEQAAPKSEARGTRE